jgi:hypothetical protein
MTSKFAITVATSLCTLLLMAGVADAKGGSGNGGGNSSGGSSSRSTYSPPARSTDSKKSDAKSERHEPRVVKSEPKILVRKHEPKIEQKTTKVEPKVIDKTKITEVPCNAKGTFSANGGNRGWVDGELGIIGQSLDAQYRGISAAQSAADRQCVAYRFFNVWRARVRLLETDFFVPMLLGKGVCRSSGWTELLAKDYREPRYPGLSQHGLAHAARQHYQLGRGERSRRSASDRRTMSAAEVWADGGRHRRDRRA